MKIYNINLELDAAAHPFPWIDDKEAARILDATGAEVPKAVSDALIRAMLVEAVNRKVGHI